MVGTVHEVGNAVTARSEGITPLSIAGPVKVPPHELRSYMVRHELTENCYPLAEGRKESPESQEYDLPDRSSEGEGAISNSSISIHQRGLAPPADMTSLGLLHSSGIAEPSGAATENSIPQTELGEPTEDDLLTRVSKASNELSASGSSVTKHAVIKATGFDGNVVNQPVVMAAIEKKVKEIRDRALEQRRQVREMQLVEAINDAVDALAARGQELSQQAICRLMGMSDGGLRYYPRTKELMARFADKTNRKSHVPPEVEGLIVRRKRPTIN